MVLFSLGFWIWNPLYFTYGFPVGIITNTRTSNNHVVVLVQVPNYYFTYCAVITLYIGTRYIDTCYIYSMRQ